MGFSPDEISELVLRIRREGGLRNSPFRIDEVRYDDEGDKLFIIAHDRTDKSVIIGNSYVIGKLREELGVKQLTVYSTLDLRVKVKRLEEAEKLIAGTPLEFLLPIIDAEKKFPPRKWPDVTANIGAVVFLSFNALSLLGFSSRTGFDVIKLGLRYTFPHIDYLDVDGPLRWLFFPDGRALSEEARGRGFDVVISDFEKPLSEINGVFLLNPFRLLHISFFELKYLFGFEKPAVFNPKELVEFITKLTYDGLMESADGARIIWRLLRKRWRTEK